MASEHTIYRDPEIWGEDFVLPFPVVQACEIIREFYDEEKIGFINAVKNVRKMLLTVDVTSPLRSARRIVIAWAPERYDNIYWKEEE